MNAADIKIADGTAVTVTKNNGTTVTGTLLRIRDKSLAVVTTDGTKVNVTLAHIATVAPVPVSDDDDTLTTAELAAIFDTSAKALRVELRRLGLGVGKGRTYGLPRSIVDTHGDDIRTGLATRANKTA